MKYPPKGFHIEPRFHGQGWFACGVLSPVQHARCDVAFYPGILNVLAIGAHLTAAREQGASDGAQCPPVSPASHALGCECNSPVA